MNFTLAAVYLLSMLSLAAQTTVAGPVKIAGPATVGGVASACGNSYLHCRSITWDATQAGTADTATFAGLLQATNADWAVVGSGGVVQNTVNQSGGSYTSTIPADFVFTSDAACATPVAGWEFESYTSTTGAMIVWVNIGTLSHTTNTVVWACYDKAAVTTQQNTVSSTWDTGYQAVYHFAGSLNLSDSTSHGNTLTNSATPATSVTGQIGNGAHYASGSWLTKTAFSLGANIVTMEAWAYSSTMTSQASGMFVEHTTVNASWEIFTGSNNGTLTMRGGNSTNTLTAAGLTNSTWTSVGGTITGTSGVVYMQGAATSGTIDAFTDASNTLTIGAYDAGAGGTYVGSLDEIRVSNIVRASSYFTARYNQEHASQTMVTVGAEN